MVDKEEVLGRLNVWSLDDDKQAAALVPLLIQSAHPAATTATSAAPSTPAHTASSSASVPSTTASAVPASSSSSSASSAAYTAYSTTAFVVCVDLSDPARLSEQLTRWQQCVLAIRDAAFSQMSKTERASLLHAVSLHTQSYYNKDLLTAPSTAAGEGEASGEAAVAEVNPHVPEVNYGASVAVVGTKADVLLGGGGEVRSGWGGGLSGDERLEFAVWLMRHAALQSASTLYLSAMPSTAASTIDTLQSYLYHRLYHFPLSSAASTPQPLPSLLPQPTFVPSGYDSVELIEASQVKEGRWKSGMRSDEVFERRRGDSSTGRTAWRETRGAVVKSVDDSVLFKNIKVQLEGNTSVQLLPPLPASASSTGHSTSSSTSGHKPRLSTVPSPTTESPAGSHPSSPTSSASSSSSRSKKNKLNPQGQVAVKAFFKSLLQQPGGSGGSGSGSGGSGGGGGGSGGEASKRSSMRKDAELELKRISEAAAAGRAEKDKGDRGEQKE